MSVITASANAFRLSSEPNLGKIRTLLLHEDEKHCHEIENRLKDLKSIEFLGYSFSIDALTPLLQTFQPEIVLLDVFFKGGKNGLEVLRYIHQNYLNTKCIVISTHVEYIRECYQSGAKAYLIQKDLNDITNTIRKVAKGDTIIPQGTIPVLLDQFTNIEKYFGLQIEKSALTKKEKQIIDLLINKTGKIAICEKLNISPFTLKRHLQILREKTGVKTTRELIQKFTSHFNSPLGKY